MENQSTPPTTAGPPETFSVARRKGSDKATHEESDPNVLKVSVEERQSYEFPEGGLEAWLVVLGSFLAMFASAGLINATGTFQSYLETHQLKSQGPETIAWIFGVYAFLSFFCGILMGPIFDARGPRPLMAVGGILTTTMLVTIGFCSQYGHFMAAIGVAGGIGGSMMTTAAISVVGHFFNRRRAFATGIAGCGGSVGATCIPLIMDWLSATAGWIWATRVLALLCFLLAAMACLFTKSALPRKPLSATMPTLSILLEPPLALIVAGVFFMQMGVFIPLNYMPSYARTHEAGDLSYQMLSIINAGMFFGRWIPGLMADGLGRINTLLLMVALCVVANTGFWLPAGDSIPLMIVYCVVFGFGSGSAISLTPVCIGQLCDTADYGRYFATANTIVSFATLTGMPVAGEILQRCDGQYWGLIAFTSSCYSMACACLVAAKVLHTGWRRFWVVW